MLCLAKSLVSHPAYPPSIQVLKKVITIANTQ